MLRRVWCSSLPLKNWTVEIYSRRFPTASVSFLRTWRTWTESSSRSWTRTCLTSQSTQILSLSLLIFRGLSWRRLKMKSGRRKKMKLSIIPRFICTRRTQLAWMPSTMLFKRMPSTASKHSSRTFLSCPTKSNSVTASIKQFCSWLTEAWMWTVSWAVSCFILVSGRSYPYSQLTRLPW